MKEFKGLATVTVFAASVMTVTAAQSTVMSIDQFTVFKNGTVLFNDTFSDGVVDPSEATFPSGATVQTSILGRSAMSESGGRLVIDGNLGPLSAATPTVSANTGGVIFTNQDQTRFSRIRFNSGAAPGSNLGLRADDDISIMGLFDLRIPFAQPDSRSTNYGIGASDFGGGNPNAGNDLMRNSVLRGRLPSDQLISFFRNDSTQGGGNVITGIGNTPSDFDDGVVDNDQILLRLRSAANDNSLMADFAYVNAPIDLTNTAAVNALSFTALGSAGIFNGEDFTRGEIRILQRVENVNLASLTAGSPTSISQQVSIAPGTIQIDVGFNYRFEQGSGDITVMLGSEILGTIMAPAMPTSGFTSAFFSLTDTTAINNLLALSPVDLKIIMDGNAGDTVLIDSIVVNGLIGFSNGTFANGLAGWTPTTSSPAGAVNVLVVQQVAEPAAVAVMLTGLAAVGAMWRRRRAPAA